MLALFRYYYSNKISIFTKIYNTNTMKITINNKDIELHFSMRILMMFEEIFNRALIGSDLATYNTLVKLFYVGVLSSARYNKIEFDMDFEQFVDYLDEQENAMQEIAKFGVWFADKLNQSTTMQQMLSATDEEASKVDVKGAKKNTK